MLGSIDKGKFIRRLSGVDLAGAFALFSVTIGGMLLDLLSDGSLFLDNDRVAERQVLQEINDVLVVRVIRVFQMLIKLRIVKVEVW